jgi:hypothetical protein
MISVSANIAVQDTDCEWCINITPKPCREVGSDLSHGIADSIQNGLQFAVTPDFEPLDGITSKAVRPFRQG